MLDMNSEQAPLSVLPGQVSQELLAPPAATSIRHDASSEPKTIGQPYIQVDAANSSLKVSHTRTSLPDTLLNATRQASLQRTRMRVRAFMCAACFCAAGFCCLVIARLDRFGWYSAVYVTGVYLYTQSGFFALLALQPSDRRCIPIVGLLVDVYLIAMLATVTLQVPDYLEMLETQKCEILEREVACWYASLLVGLRCFDVPWGFVCVGRIALAAICEAESPVLLAKIWSWVGYITLTFGLTSFARMVASAGAGQPDVALRVGLTAIPPFLMGVVSIWGSEFRSHLQAWLMWHGDAAAAAAGIAELLGGRSPEEVLALARGTFSYVPSQYLQREDMQQKHPDSALARFTHAASLGSVDTFVSHSWTDNPEKKWTELQQYILEFKQQHRGRAPKLWIDKYCIDQSRIDESLACLPVYLSGCRKLLILCGNTYLRRLWCLMEIFVFVTMGGRAENLEVRLLGGTGLQRMSSTQSVESLMTSLEDFDPWNARCTTDYDTERLREVIRSTGFRQIRQVVMDAFASQGI